MVVRNKRLTVALGTGCIFGIIGIATLLFSSAAVQNIAIEAESAATGVNFSVQSDPDASNGSYIRFNATPASCPSPQQLGFINGTLTLPPAGCNPYSEDGRNPFNQALPDQPPLDPQSSAIIATMNSWGLGPSDLRAGYSSSYNDYQHPTYYSHPSDPSYKIVCTKYGGDCEINNVIIHIPDGAMPAQGGDGHMVVVDESNTEYDLWQVGHNEGSGCNPNTRSYPSSSSCVYTKVSPSTVTTVQGNERILYVSYGGITSLSDSLSANPGNAWNRYGIYGLGSDATAAHFGLRAGMIRAKELIDPSKEISHALFVTIKCERQPYVYPAGGLGANCGGNAPAEGQRIYLDDSLNGQPHGYIDSLGAPLWKKKLLRALNRYGMFVGDTGGSPWDLHFESGVTYASFGQEDEFVTYAKNNVATDSSISSDGGTYSFDLASGVDWTRLKVVSASFSQIP